jgi:alanyl-tRNA synthetase
MQYMTHSEIRVAFLQYFANLAEYKHEVVASSSLVPAKDPSLLFTNAGMVPFKDLFLGAEKKKYNIATSSQRCLRVGGKHNDLDQVGFTKRHHTFFEMLGNFSFGAYFKEDAIKFAWNFLTQVLDIPVEKLWVSVYKDDQESADIWLKTTTIDKSRISYCGDEDNFWSMGETGPCGPCSEIFYDNGSDVAGGPPGSPDQDGDRYVEIWNLVFMQYNRLADKTLVPLPKPAVDTGMGLERITAVMQGVGDNFDIDLFKELIAFVDSLSGNKIDGRAKRVIVDHIRSSAFLIMDQVYPSNEGRGYVLRRVIRRAVRFGYKSGLQIPFLYKLVEPLVAIMGDAYSDLVVKKDIIIATIKREEEQFAETLSSGMKELEKAIKESNNDIIAGEVAFKLYDTYGFPLDLTKDILAEKNIGLDEAGFIGAMSEQKAKSKSSKAFIDMKLDRLNISGSTKFTGYDSLVSSSVVQHILSDNQHLKQLKAGAEGIVILDQTPFYAEGGGQVGDKGLLTSKSGTFKVSNTLKQDGIHLHYGAVQEGIIKVGDEFIAEVDKSRQKIKQNHSATHLLHAALREVLGKHVLQKGSLVTEDRLRFDFAHHNPMTSAEKQLVQGIVNNQISHAVPTSVKFSTQEEAKKSGAIALFDEKYDDEVRVVSLGDFSSELCGGTHVSNIAEIGGLKIISETGIASGIRRIEAITGGAIITELEGIDNRVAVIAKTLKVSPDRLLDKVNMLLAENITLKSELQSFQSQKLDLIVRDIIINVESFAANKNLYAHIFQDLDIKMLRDVLDKIKQHVETSDSLIILASITSTGKVPILVYSGSMLHEDYAANLVLKSIAVSLGGSGGGKASMAQGVLSSDFKVKDFFSNISIWLDSFTAAQ